MTIDDITCIRASTYKIMHDASAMRISEKARRDIEIEATAIITLCDNALNGQVNGGRHD